MLQLLMLTTFLLAAVSFGTSIDTNRNKFHDGANAMSVTTMAAFPSAESESSITTSSTPSTPSTLTSVVRNVAVIYQDGSDISDSLSSRIHVHRTAIEEVEMNNNDTNEQGELGLPMLCDQMMERVQNLMVKKRKKRKNKICTKKLRKRHQKKFAGVVVGKKVMKLCPKLCDGVISKKKKQEDGVGPQIEAASLKKACPDITGKYPIGELANSLCSDDGYDDEQTCQYSYVYTGCTWEELKCEVPTVVCTCNDIVSQNGRWSCLSHAMQRCPSTIRTPPPIRIPTRRSLSTTQTSSSSFQQKQQQQQHDDRISDKDPELQQSSCEPVLPSQGSRCNPEEPLPTPCD